MTVHHPLASLATFVVVFACVVGAVGALPIGLYGGSYHPITSPIVPYLGQFSYLYRHPYINLSLYNPFQRYFYLVRPDSTDTYTPDIPTPLVTDKKNTNWVLTILKWPGWDTVITDEVTRKKWKKLIGNLSNYTDINNPEWSKQLRQWIGKQPDIVQLFSKVSNFMVKSPRWEQNIKVWLNFTSISADYVQNFKKWLKMLITDAKPKNPSSFPVTIPRFPRFPSRPWQPPSVPWQPPSVPWQPPFVPKNVFPDFDNRGPIGVDPRIPQGDDELFKFVGQPSGPMDLPPSFYPQLCTPYGECLRPPLQNFPQFPREFPQFQFQFPQFPIMTDPYSDRPGFDENPFYDEGQGYEQPNFDNIRQRNKNTATENQMQNQIETIYDTQAKSCPQCEEISIILDLRRSNFTFCKTVLTAPRQSLKNLLILASFENKCFNLTTKVRDSRLRSPRGDYIFSLNGLSETSYKYWISYKVNGTKDTELNTFQPQNGDHIIIDYTDWNTIVNKIAIPK